MHNKYKDNSLTSTELLELREQVNHLSNDELEVLLLQDWENDEFDKTILSTENELRIKTQIAEKIESKPKMRVSFMVWSLRIAGAIIIPLLLFSTYHFYNKNQQLNTAEMVVTTAVEERANITLPDGTKVIMNEESTLRYTLGSYNQKVRKINFEGEAYFDIVYDNNKAFEIETSAINIKVLGTKFNLQAREKNDIVEIFLKEGHLLLAPLQFQNTQELFSSQNAVFNKQTGHFAITKKSANKSLSWIKKELIFEDESLLDVVALLDKNYNIRIILPQVDSIECDRFSGTLPSNDLQQAIDIIRKSYNFNYTLTNNTIIFTQK